MVNSFAVRCADELGHEPTWLSSVSEAMLEGMHASQFRVWGLRAQEVSVGCRACLVEQRFGGHVGGYACVQV